MDRHRDDNRVRINEYEDSLLKFLYSPSIHECPAEFFHHFEYFGMGHENARKLARKINLLYPRSHILILGSAGALNPRLRSGDTFLVSHVKIDGKFTSLNIPDELQHLAQAKVISLPDVVTQPEDKKKIWKDTGADLVDCESGVIYEELLDQFQERLIIIRGVIDEQKDRMDFIQGMKVQWGQLWRPQKFVSFLKLIRSYSRYRDGVGSFFEKTVHALQMEDRLRDEDSQSADLSF